MSNIRELIRPVVRGAYDQQKLRIQMGNRIVANFKSKLGVEPSTTEEETLSPDAQMVLTKLKNSYKLLGTAVAAFKKTKGELKPFAGDELISNEVELVLVEQYLDLEDQELRTFKRLGKVLETIPIYNQYLSKVKGIGPAMAAVLLSEIDIKTAKYPSSIWSYAGLDVAQDGKGRSRRTEHLVQRPYTNKDGEEDTRNSITFNPWLKTKLIGVLGPSFLRSGNEKYRAIYDGYKNRLENHEAHKEKSKGHRHAMATRYMVKIFLADLYREWRTSEGLEVAPSYQEAKLGHTHAA